MQSWTPVTETPSAIKAGLRFGSVGTHTSRTMMLAELVELLRAVPAQPFGADAARAQASLFEPTISQPLLFSGQLPTRADYVRAVVDDNVLGKDTAASRRGTLQRLTELYALDPLVAIFRVLRRVWEVDVVGRPLIALLGALARDPLLRATAGAVLPLPVGSELSRGALCDSLLAAAGDVGRADALAAPAAPARFNPAILDKVARNAASSWAQAGHVEGRVRKIRRRVRPTPGSAALALWLGSRQGLAGDYLLSTLWAAALDASPEELIDQAIAAKQHGLLRVVAGGGVREIDVSGLDPAGEQR